jgi:molecular chaperone DnaJ
MSKDYYKILGVSRSASAEEIKRAFHQLAHKYHPHKGGDAKKFKEINEAYQILSNKEKKAQYDQFGRVFEGGAAGPEWARGNPFQGEAGFDFGGQDFSDIFEDFFDFGFGPSRSRKRDLKKGKDIRIDLELSLEETLKNSTKKVNLYKETVCSRCKGSGAEPGTSLNKCFACGGKGEVQHVKRTFLGSFTRWGICPECRGEGQKPEKPCNVCKGEGRIKASEEIEIFIPAGVDSNQLIRVSGKGEAGRRGGQAGDLYLRILVKNHPVFERQGDDLFASVPISFSQAALGDQIEITGLDNERISIKVPAGSESGRILRIRDKGTPHFSGFGKGSLYLELSIKTPKKLTKKQKELLEKLKGEGM